MNLTDDLWQKLNMIKKIKAKILIQNDLHALKVLIYLLAIICA